MTNSPENVKVTWALRLAAQGHRIHLLEPNSKVPPAGSQWKAEATNDPATIRQWLTDQPDANYLVAPDEQHFILDVDVKGARNGITDLENLEELYGELPDTLIVKTPSGGYHIYWHGSAPVSAGKASLGGGIDVRGNFNGKAGYVVGPGSTIDGKPYTVVADHPIAPAPSWLIHLCEQPATEVKKAESDVPQDDPLSIAEAKRVIARFKPAIEGQHGDDHTYQLCAILRRDFNLSTDTALGLMQEWNSRCEPMWLEGELRAKLEHAGEYGQNEPGSSTPKSVGDAFTLPPDKTATATDFGGVRFERMSDVALEKITWTWHPRIPADMLSIIGGDPDCGKSTLVAGLIAAITTGGPLPLNGGNAEKGSVLVLNAEDAAAKVLGPRLAAAGANMELVHRVNPMVLFENGARVLDLRLDLPALEAKMQQLQKAGEPPVRLITIDPLNAYYGAGVDGNNAAELRRLLTPLAEWAENNHITILGIHHLNKGNASGNAINRLNGSHAVGAAARSVILVTPERGDDGQETGRFLFMRGKNNLAPRNVKNLAYRIEARAVTTRDGSSDDHPVVVWDGEVAVTASEAFDPSYGKGSKQDKAETFLLSALADGRLDRKELERMAAERHIGWRTVEAVKAKLSIRSEQEGFGRDKVSYWRLPNKEAEAAANDVNRVAVDPDDELLYETSLH